MESLKPQTWREARDQALVYWRRIQARYERMDKVELLTELNAVFSLCHLSQAAAPPGERRCPYCLIYRQFGGCREISGEMSERVARGALDELRALVDEFIRELETLELPDAASVT